MGGRGVHRWRGGSGREEEGEEGNPIVWGVDGLIELQKMGGNRSVVLSHRFDSQFIQLLSILDFLIL